jgi:hypothetical protein
VHLNITPSTAVVLVDGVVLPRGTDTISNPRAGATTSVLVWAERHDDTVVLIDSATPDEVDVTLTPTARQGSGTGNVPTAAAKAAGQLPPTPGSTAVPSPPVARPPRPAGGPAKDNGLPAAMDAPPNPYD